MKKILVTFIIAAMGLTLVACSSNEKKDEVAKVTEVENTEQTINVYGLWFMVFSSFPKCSPYKGV